jgi:hypothetical protein
MRDRRHLADRIDLEILRLLVIALVQADGVQLVRHPELLEHPMHDVAARHRRVVENDLVHGCLPAKSN